MNPELTQSVSLRLRSSNATGASQWPFYWLCGLVLSFAYERPLVYLTPYDRTNPRLFDVMVVLGILTVLPTLRYRVRLPKAYRIWAFLVGWFCFCAILSAIYLPPTYGKFSLFFAFKYLVGLLVVYMALRIPLSADQKRILHGMMVLGGVFVALYCIPQYIAGTGVVVVKEDLEVQAGEGVLAGPFGASYFELAQYSSLSFACALTFFMTARSELMRLAGPIVAAFIGWPLLFSGARTGLALGVISVVVLFIYDALCAIEY